MPDGCLTDIFKKLCCVTDDATSHDSASTLQSTAASDGTTFRRNLSSTGSSRQAIEKKTRTRLATLLRTHPTSSNAPAASLAAQPTTSESPELRAPAPAPSPTESATLALPTSPATNATQEVTTKRRQEEAALNRSIANRPRRAGAQSIQINPSAAKQTSGRPPRNRKSADRTEQKINATKKMNKDKPATTKSTTENSAPPPALPRARFSTSPMKELTMPSGRDAHSNWPVGGRGHTAQSTPQAAAGQRVERAPSKRMQSAIAR